MAETDRDDILHTKSGQEGQLLPSQFDLDGQPGDYPTLQRHQVVDLGSNLYSDRSSYVENPIQAGTVEISNDESPRKIQIPSPARQFSLQEAPVIDRGLGIQSIDYGEEENDGFDMHVTSPFSVTKNSLPLQSPHSVMGNHEPSPQLPPPASSNSLKHIANDEVATLRKKLVTETKTPAEYTLHIIFTQFVRHAERKLNMCLEFPENAEHPIIDILGEGADPQFDKIIANLGYIARRKPKPVIDSVMFWRKSKNEVAALAANEVGRLVNEQSTKDPQQMAQNSTEQPKPRAKRSLSLMKSKSIYRMTGAHRRNQSSSSMPPAPLKTSEELTRVLLDKKRDSLEESISLTRETAIQASRKSLALIFILCRVLIEVVKQTSFDNDDLGDKLEEIVYTQLKSTDPVATSQSLVRSANWNLFSELLGIMSEKRFMSVSDRFIADLETIPLVVNQEDEPRLHLLIHGMRYLKLTNYPLENFEESADFLHSLSKFFAKTRNECLIFAYCEVLSCLMIPLANTLTAEVNHPTWLEAVERIFDTGYRLWYNIAKSTLSSQNVSLVNPSNGLSMHPSMYANNSWALSMYLMTSALSVSRNEHFSKVWFQIIEGNTYKLKAKVDPEEKATFIICIARLIWVYLYRLPESLNNTVKRLESLFDILFFNSSNYNKKQHWLTSDYYLINALVQLIRIVGYQHLNFVLDNVLLKLLKSPSLGSERLLFVLKSYLLIVEDHEMGNKPVFPTDKVFSSRILVEDFSVNTKQNAPKGKEEQSRKKNVTINDFLFKARNSNNAASHDEICRTLGIFLKTLDEKLGCVIVPPEQSGNMSKSLSPFSAFNFGIENAFQQVQDVDIELFATLIDAIPWTMISQSEKPSASGLSFKAIVDLLTRNAVHSNPRVSKASVQALHNLASKKNANILLSIFAKIAFQFSEKPGPSYSSNYFNSNEYLKLCKVYVGLLNCWLVQFKETLSETKEKKNPLAQDDEMMNRDVLNDLYQINYKTDDIPLNTETSQRTNDDFEWKNIITAIEEIEGNALYFICSLDAKIRHYGISILKLVELFDQVIYKITDENEFAADIGTRLIDVMENIDFFGLIRPMKNELSLAETSRLAKWKNKSNTLIKLAESDHGIDTTLGFGLSMEALFDICVLLFDLHERAKNLLPISTNAWKKEIDATLYPASENNQCQNTNIDQWFPFEARIGCFNYLKEWSLVGEFEDIAEDRYRTMVNKANQKEVTAATIEIEKKAFQHASLSCMAVLCSGPVKQEIELPGQVAVMSFDIPGVMAWIHSLFSSDQVHLHDIENYMKRSIAEDQEKPYEVLCLSTYLVGNESYNVRSVAVELLNYLEAKHFQNHSVDKFVESVHSKSKVVYKKALYDISASLALLGPTGSFIRISYLTRYFNVVDSSSRRDILSCLLPWVLTISLEYESEKAISTQTEKPRTRKLNGLSTMVLNNLFEITVNFSSKIPNEVEALWVALAAKPEHFDMVVDFLINNCLERRNSRFVQYALQVINYLAFSQSDQSHLIVKLISNLQARNMVPTQMKGQSSNDQGETHFPYEANLWEIVPSSEKDTAFSL
ncbi:hypothetical protein QFC19_008904, partial [Naganishia cerealis]